MVIGASSWLNILFKSMFLETIKPISLEYIVSCVPNVEPAPHYMLFVLSDTVTTLVDKVSLKVSDQPEAYDTIWVWPILRVLSINTFSCPFYPLRCWKLPEWYICLRGLSLDSFLFRLHQMQSTSWFFFIEFDMSSFLISTTYFIRRQHK